MINEMSFMRIWSDVHMLELLFTGKVEDIEANVKFYTTKEEISKVSTQLKDWFPKTQEDVLSIDFGSKDEGHIGRLNLRLSTINKRGHIVVEVRLSNNEAKPNYMCSEFSIKTDIPSINRFGQDMKKINLDDGICIKLNG